MDTTAAPTAPSHDLVTYDELTMANRNPGMPLEVMRHDTTPTGLHYVLVHFDIPQVDVGAWRLRIGGEVDEPVELDLDRIRSLPTLTMPVTLECAGNGRARLDPRPVSMPWSQEAIGTAEWTGTPVFPLLEAAGLSPGAVEVVFWGSDRGIQGEEEHDYARSLTIPEVRRPEVMLAYEMNGEPLPIQHGYPLRLIVPGWYGFTSVKWLESIEVVNEPFDGFQQRVPFRYQVHEEDPGEPVDRIRVRSLMIPPGIPDCFTRHRYLEAGPVTLRGRAWSGSGSVERVEVGVDGQWQDAVLGPGLGEYAWRSWSFEWDALPGEHELSCRATDGTGAVQPLDQDWNWQGMGNNAVQIVSVTVR